MRAAITDFIYVKQERQGGEPIKLYCKKSRYLNNYFSQLSLFITRNKPVRGLKTENSSCHWTAAGLTIIILSKVCIKKIFKIIFFCKSQASAINLWKNANFYNQKLIWEQSPISALYKCIIINGYLIIITMFWFKIILDKQERSIKINHWSI